MSPSSPSYRRRRRLPIRQERGSGSPSGRTRSSSRGTSPQANTAKKHCRRKRLARGGWLGRSSCSGAHSLPGRAVLAVLLTIGFYLLAVGLIIALLGVPFIEITVLHRISLRISLFCLAGAALIAYSLTPTFEHFRAPGQRDRKSVV